MPHNGTEIPLSIQKTMTHEALKRVDTDWFLNQLYQFAEKMGFYILQPRYSRYVIDLNRSKDNISLYPGQDTTELCPTTTFTHQAIYKKHFVLSNAMIQERIHDYWDPYHHVLQKILKAMRKQLDHVILFEAHSIASKVPRFFDGVLPDFNFGTQDQQTCGSSLNSFITHWQPQGYTKIVNGRFKGGYITRKYANPKKGIHSMQLELSQATYMNESLLSYDIKKAEKLQIQLEDFFISLQAHQ
jgi:N-formylglutamate deformylase